MNKELDLAQHFVSQTNRNIFVTGKAGTGKTTFLRGLQETLNKRMVVVAPTGVAAINARGVTIHSFFQLPFGPIIPNSGNTIQRKFNRQKIDIIKSLDLVVIDEISMVRADVLDGIDEVLRRYKDRTKVFGGVQMLFIGDLQQLSPVMRPNDWELLRAYYNNAYFFSSLSYQQANVVPVELKHIYRQQNADFIKILNEIRNNTLSNESADILNRQYRPDFSPRKDEGFITLTTHNNRANKINQEQIDELAVKPKKYKATVTGNFTEGSYPVDEVVVLKLGAQVMFVKNDPSNEKKYFNGKIGTVVELERDYVVVQCEDEIIDVGYDTWENIKYSLDDTTKEISENVEGTFTQIPLRLAWAITIHKSQGLTFERAIIDAEASFAHGQTYVALSRCKTLEGIVLKSKLSSSSIVNDATVNAFNRDMEERQPSEEDLKNSKKQYQLDLIQDLFNYGGVIYPLNRLIDLYYKHQSALQGNIIEPLLKIKDEGVVPLMKIANGFKKQLHQLTVNIDNPEGDKQVQERFKKAVTYFVSESDSKINQVYKTFSFATDNKAIEKDIERALENFEELIRVKNGLLSKMDGDFSVREYLRVRAKIVLEKPKSSKVKRKEVTTTVHEKLFDELRELRTSIAAAENIGPYAIFNQKTLFELCELLPQTKSELKKVNGMGKVRVEKYGDEILDVINDYAKSNNLKSQIELVEVEKQPKGSSKIKTLDLYKEGLSIQEITEKRALATSTIEGHLADFVSEGVLAISELIPEEKIKKGLEIIRQNSVEGLSELKKLAGSDFSYGELRMLVNHNQAE